MQFNVNHENIQKSVDLIMHRYPILPTIIDAIAAVQGVPYIVGGAVRDAVLGLPIKDIDIEVHNISLEQLEETLKKFGVVDLVGKSFGVLRIHGLDIDWSIPRTDSAGRKPRVNLVPAMNFADAAARRDLTMNAMGINLLTKELVDPFGGIKDIENNILRAPVPQLFTEDPLRFFRVMQFIGRFNMQPDETLNAICKTMDIAGVSRERIESEFQKWLLKSKKPSVVLDWLVRIDRLSEILPEVNATRGVFQEPSWHPEGDVFEHTKQALDASAVLEYPHEEEKLIIMYAALCHDLGKANTTEIIDGVITSRGHEITGAQLAKKMLKRIMRNKYIIDAVTKLVKYHMAPGQLVKSFAKPAAYKRLAHKLAPEITLEMLGLLALADRRGRNPRKGEPLHIDDVTITEFIQKAQEADVLTQIEKPILLGRDLLPEVQPGTQMGMLLKQAYKLQIDQGIKDKKILKDMVLQSLKN